MPARKTLVTVLEQFKVVHSTRYDYSKVVYHNDHTKVIIICPLHGEFLQTPGNHLQGSGCTLCGFRKRACSKTLTQEQCLQRFRDKHGLAYSYDDVVYRGQNIPVTIHCPIHGPFEQQPAIHWLGMGCRACGIDRTADAQRMTTSEFIRRANVVHSNRYTYPDTVYTRGHDKVIIHCEDHGPFEQDPYNHLKGFGCSMCTPVGFSKLAVEWVEFMSGYYGVDFQHAGNAGEVIVPGTRYRADGYSDRCVLEFDGDYYHGNPKFYPIDKTFPHSKTGITFGDQLRRTVRKRVTLRSLGFKVIHIWESDWKRAKDAVVTLQCAFRSKRRT